MLLLHGRCDFRLSSQGECGSLPASHPPEEQAGKKMEPSLIIERIERIAHIVVDHPLIYMPMIGAWLITELYFIINREEAHGHTYVMSTGIALIFTSYMISPFAIKDIHWSLMHMRTLVVMSLFLYGLFLVVFGIMKKFPGFMAEFFGDPGHALVPGMMGVLYVEQNIPFDRVTFSIIVVPVLILSMLKTYRRLTYRVSMFINRDKKQDGKGAMLRKASNSGCLTGTHSHPTDSSRSDEDPEDMKD
jgi:hypothetical protein